MVRLSSAFVFVLLAAVAAADSMDFGDDSSFSSYGGLKGIGLGSMLRNGGRVKINGVEEIGQDGNNNDAYSSFSSGGFGSSSSFGGGDDNDGDSTLKRRFNMEITSDGGNGDYLGSTSTLQSLEDRLEALEGKETSLSRELRLGGSGFGALGGGPLGPNDINDDLLMDEVGSPLIGLARARELERLTRLLARVGRRGLEWRRLLNLAAERRLRRLAMRRGYGGMGLYGGGLYGGRLYGGGLYGGGLYGGGLYGGGLYGGGGLYNPRFGRYGYGRLGGYGGYGRYGGGLGGYGGRLGGYGGRRFDGRRRW